MRLKIRNEYEQENNHHSPVRFHYADRMGKRENNGVGTAHY